MVFTNHGKLLLLDATEPVGEEPPFDISGDVIKVALMKSAYTLDIDNHDHFADTGVSTNEIVATNYTARGNALGGKAIAIDTVNDRAEFTASDTVFTNIGNGTNDTFTQILILREVDTAPTNANTSVIAHATVSSTLTNGGNITLQWNTEGVLQVT